MGIKESVVASLQAKAAQTSIESLAAEGRRNVRTIRVKEVAALVKEAVDRAVQDSGLLTPEQVEEIVSRGESEFRDLHGQWKEKDRLAAERLEEIKALRKEKEELEKKLAGLPEGGGGPESTDLVMRLFQELATVKAQVAQAASGSEGSRPEDLIDQKLSAIVGSIDEKLDKFGRKMGISSAVETADVDFGSLFQSSQEEKLESNIDTVEVKERKGGGIAENLEKIKKLKGGG